MQDFLKVNFEKLANDKKVIKNRVRRVFSNGQLNSDSDLVCFIFQLLE